MKIKLSDGREVETYRMDGFDCYHEFGENHCGASLPEEDGKMELAREISRSFNNSFLLWEINWTAYNELDRKLTMEKLANFFHDTQTLEELKRTNHKLNRMAIQRRMDNY